MMMRLSAFAALMLLLAASLASAFVVAPPSSRRTVGVYSRPALVALREASEQAEPESTKEPVLEEESETETDENESESDEEKEEEPPKEDPEVTALEEEIASLESELKAKQSQLSYQQEQAEQYTKAGYARKVAEMETMRRTRSRMNSSSRETAMAAVVQNFLPILEDLDSLKSKYGEDSFGSGYNALPGNLRTALKELGCEEFSVKEGDVVDARRVVVVEEEYSDEYPANTVIRPLAVGMELQGNVMKMAECVASLGSEAAEEEESEEEGESEEEASGEGESEEKQD